jgi:hypothetical protein
MMVLNAPVSPVRWPRSERASRASTKPIRSRSARTSTAPSRAPSRRLPAVAAPAPALADHRRTVAPRSAIAAGASLSA